MKRTAKKIPYGEANFKELITQGYIYIDKTKYIEILENLDEKCLVYLRPRKFDKTLFLSMLKYYYDIIEKDNFTQLFSNFYIGNNPTELKNRYLVLTFNFSGVETQTFESIYSGFFSKVIEGIEKFTSAYGKYFKTDSITRITESKTPEEMIMRLVTEVGKTPMKIYLLIDETEWQLAP